MSNSLHRKHILITAFALAIPAWFLVNAPIKDSYWPISVLAILGFSAPVVIGAVKWLGARNGLLLTTGLGIYALLFETLAIKTGWPYGHFSYSGILGPQLFDTTPVTVLVAWTPLMLGALPLIRKGSYALAVASLTALVVLADIILDPAAVQVGFWAWDQPGFYYGVPFINFVGWVISAGLASLVLIKLKRQVDRPMPLLLVFNFWAILIFWTFVNLFSGQLIPAIIGILYAVGVFRSLLKNRLANATLN